MKPCKTCKEVKPLDEFYTHPGYKDGHYLHCKPCSRAAASRRYHSSPEAKAKKSAYEKARRATRPRVMSPEETLRSRLWTHYRITPERYHAMLAEQDGRCAICKTEEPGGMGRWHVDHDHACCPGKKSCGQCVRSLLCSTCNVGLGMFKDSPAHLRAALAYLEGDAAMQALGAIA